MPAPGAPRVAHLDCCLVGAKTLPCGRHSVGAGAQSGDLEGPVSTCHRCPACWSHGFDAHVIEYAPRDVRDRSDKKRGGMTGQPAYDAIAEHYRASKWLLFRHFIERYTLFEVLGDLRGRTMLDLACGDGVYTRQFKRAGAVEVTGVDIS